MALWIERVGAQDGECVQQTRHRPPFYPRTLGVGQQMHEREMRVTAARQTTVPIPATCVHRLDTLNPGPEQGCVFSLFPQPRYRTGDVRGRIVITAKLASFRLMRRTSNFA